MRIGLDISKAAPPRDGIGNFTFELLRALLPLVHAGGDTLYLYGLDDDAATALRHELDPGDGAHPVNSESVHWQAGPPRSRDALDLFHSTAWTFPVAVGCPILFTCYDLTFWTHADCHTLNNKVHCSTGLLKAHMAGAHFLAISRFTADELQRLADVDPERIDVVYPAAADRYRPLDPEPVRRRLRERFHVDRFVLAVGTIEPRKNLLRLLQAYGALSHDLRQRFPLLLAGGAGWQDASELEQILGRPELSTVRRLGRVDDDELLDLYNGAEAFLYPSLGEGFGLPVVEAMACGTPVLTSSVSATAEVAAVGTDPAALLVDPLDVDAIGDGLRRLLRDEPLRQTLVQAGKIRSRDFSWQKTAKATRNLYHRLNRGA